MAPEVATDEAGTRPIRVRDALRVCGRHAVVMTPSADLRWTFGIDRPAGERMIAGIVRTDGYAAVVAPDFELDAMTLPPGVERIAFSDGEDPLPRLAALLASAGSIGIGSATPASVLLRLQTVVTATWSDAAEVLAPLRARKSAEEITLLTAAARRADAALVGIEELAPGRTERELATLVRRRLEDAGLSRVEVVLASGAHTALLRHRAGDRVLVEGDALLVDVSGTASGYHADLTRTLAVGPAPAGFEDVQALVAAASEAGFAAARAGARAVDVDAAVRAVVEEAGYGDCFPHRSGHGIGLELHEAPSIAPGVDTVLQEGNVLSIQPGLYLPGRFGVRREEVGVVGQAGARALSAELVV